MPVRGRHRACPVTRHFDTFSAVRPTQSSRLKSQQLQLPFKDPAKKEEKKKEKKKGLRIDDRFAAWGEGMLPLPTFTFP